MTQEPDNSVAFLFRVPLVALCKSLPSLSHSVAHLAIELAGGGLVEAYRVLQPHSPDGLQHVHHTLQEEECQVSNLKE